jgi:hypothetical protein
MSLQGNPESPRLLRGSFLLLYISMTAPAGYVTRLGVFGSNSSVRGTVPCGLINSTEWGVTVFRGSRNNPVWMRRCAV